MGSYTATWVILAGYFAGLVGILLFVVVKRCSSSEKYNVESHYVGNRSIRGITLGLTTFASICSGYTVTGLPAEAFRTGFLSLRWFLFGPFFIITYLLIAPRLQYLASTRGYVSGIDFLRDRFAVGPIFPSKGCDLWGSGLHWLVTFTFLIPCIIYLLAQFIAFGANLAALSEGLVSPAVSGGFLFVLLSTFEICGGLKVVVLTDVIQGSILLISVVSWIFLQAFLFGGLESASNKLQPSAPQFFSPPEETTIWSWLNFGVLVGCGRVVFPDVVTRICAAQSQTRLRVSTILLTSGAVLLTSVISFIGIHGRALFPDLPMAKSNAIFTMVMLEVIDSGVVGTIFGSLFLAGSTAAIMSTADSILMEVAKLAAMDVCSPILQSFGYTVDESRLMRVGQVMTLSIAGLCWVLTSSGAIGIANLSGTLALQNIFGVAVFPVFFWSMYNDSIPTWLAVLSVLFGNVAGILSWVLKTNPDTLIGDPMPYLPTVVFAVNIVCVGAAAHCIRYASKGKYWEWWSQEISKRDAKKMAAGSVTACDIFFPQPSVARPSVSAPLDEPIHRWHMIVVLMLLTFLALPFGGSNVNLTWGMPDWGLVFLFRVLAILIFLMYIIIYHWSDAPSSKTKDVADSLGCQNAQGEGLPDATKPMNPDAGRHESNSERTSHLCDDARAHLAASPAPKVVGSSDVEHSRDERPEYRSQHCFQGFQCCLPA